MATAAKCFCRQARHLSHRTQWLSQRQRTALDATPLITQRIGPRLFSSSRCLQAEGENFTGAENDVTGSESSSDTAPYFNDSFFASLDRNDQATYRTLPPSERQRMEEVSEQLLEDMQPGSKTSRSMEIDISRYAEEIEREFPEPPEVFERRATGFFQMGEREDMGADEHDFNEDDIPANAHKELEQHREIREYARLASWEMPLLSTLAIPFQPPTTTTTPLRFRYTSYMGDPHPAARKVVVDFAPSSLNLTPIQERKLIKLAGPRYHMDKIKISCESFETQAQNKRYLGDLVARLLAEAKDPNADTFEDIPFDFRHTEAKLAKNARFKRHERQASPRILHSLAGTGFPREWKLTSERKKALDEARRSRHEDEQRRLTEGNIVSGMEAIEEGRRIDLERIEEPVMARARTQLPAGKMGRKEMGQKGR